MYLLDVNCLIARCDQAHEHHLRVSKWWQLHAAEGWATCPLTENALLRIMGHPSYPGGLGNPEAVRPLLQQLRQVPGHVFFADTVSLADESLVPDLDRVGARELTDVYLLALAVHHGAWLVTLDRRMNPRCVAGGREALMVLGER